MNSISSIHRNLILANNNRQPAISTTTYTYTGSNQSMTIPSGTVYMTVKCWGAGGGSKQNKNDGLPNSYGGGGGYTFASIAVSAGQTYNVIVGQGGQTNTNGQSLLATYGGGSGQPLAGDAYWSASSGGGRSAIEFLGNDIVTAGGGGASGHSTGKGFNMNGGAGGGLIGGNAIAVGGSGNYGGGFGGTQTSGGAAGNIDGSTVQDGSPSSAGTKYNGGLCGKHGGAAGGGYYGGGSGNMWFNINSPNVFCGGGGGSSYVDPTKIYNSTPSIITQANVNEVANKAGLPSGNTEVGAGGSITGSAGGNGLVIVSFYG